MGNSKKLRQDYKITVIFKDEVVVTKFHEKNIAMDAIIEMRRLFPDLFMSGALEEHKGWWKVIWVLGVDKLS